MVVGDRSSLQQEEIPAQDAAAARKKLWFAAVKPPMYSVCIIPVLVRRIKNRRLPDESHMLHVWSDVGTDMVTVCWFHLVAHSQLGGTPVLVGSYI